jgi:probable HAF family extracellular repeat protein
MAELGTLGGTTGFANFLNSRGEVVGSSNLTGDLTHHPFLWSRGELKDLGTLGGHNGEAFWINDGGDIVGWANNPVPCSGCAEPGEPGISRRSLERGAHAGSQNCQGG